MVPSFVIIEAAAKIAVAVLGSGIGASLASAIKTLISQKQHSVAVKLPSGKEIVLEIDDRLSQEKVSELISAAVRSAQSGDEDGVKRVIDASHAASLEARMGAAS
ncbi:hypothetical protein [Methylorubrum sp. POS3]|uniref:hypothetical protein n=1 Tax=Methylorubrum sp. POS3 TaxID=2998492 RepID=UPI003729F227